MAGFSDHALWFYDFRLRNGYPGYLLHRSGRDAEEEDAPVAGAKDVAELRKEIALLTKSINEMKEKLG